MSQRPEDLLRELPSQFRWPHRPGPMTDYIDMEFLISQVENPQLRNQLTILRLETASQILRTMADAAQKAAGLIGSQR
jgi:hypothetical protein